VGDVYFRTLAANGTPSTAKAPPTGLAVTFSKSVFDNREAEHRAVSATPVCRRRSSPSCRDTWRAACRGRRQVRERCASIPFRRRIPAFDKAVAERTLALKERPLLNGLTWNRACRLTRRRRARSGPGIFRCVRREQSKVHRLAVWLDARALTDERSRPVVRAGAWEALIFALSEHTANRLEFFRVDPKGEFYLRRLLQGRRPSDAS